MANPGRLIGAIALLLVVALDACKKAEAPTHAWTYFGGDKGFTRYAPLGQIDKGNVDKLEIVWRHPAMDSVEAARQAEESQRAQARYMATQPDSVRRRYDSLTRANPPMRGGSVRGIPIFVDSVLYVPNNMGMVEAIDAGTGKSIWIQQARDTTQKERAGWGNMGLAYWSDSAGTDRRIIHDRNGFLYELDPATGKAAAGFGGKDGRVDLSQYGRSHSWSAGPIVVQNVIVIAGTLPTGGDGGFTRKALPEDVRGYDVKTGELLWTFHVVPKPGEFGNDSWGDSSWKDAGNLGQWGPLAGDDSLGYVYVPLSAPTAAYYAGHRPGNNLFSNSLVCIDVKTGKRVWHFQATHHDLWEYDLASPPVLGDINVNGKRIKAVMQTGKVGYVYVLDRVTGDPVWPIEEKPVPASSMPGEHASPTQPVPTKPLPVDRQGMSKEDLIDWPGFAEKAKAKADSFVMGPMYMPPVMIDSAKGIKGTLQTPGIWGAGSWNTGAFDPETGYFYAVTHSLPIVMGLKKTPKDAKVWDGEKTHTGKPNELISYNSPWGTPNDTHVDSVPIFKPPWGRITAINMNTGDHAWMVPNGDAAWNHPALKRLNLPPTGIPSRTPALVTKTLLFVGDGGMAAGSAHQSMWGTHFRAYDKKSGNVIWDKELPAGLTSGPMSYMYRGRQFIVVPIGGMNHAPEWIALALPEKR